MSNISKNLVIELNHQNQSILSKHSNPSHRNHRNNSSKNHNNQKENTEALKLHYSSSNNTVFHLFNSFETPTNIKVLSSRTYALLSYMTISSFLKLIEQPSSIKMIQTTIANKNNTFIHSSNLSTPKLRLLLEKHLISSMKLMK